jgi:hypothetical protein
MRRAVHGPPASGCQGSSTRRCAICASPRAASPPPPPPPPSPAASAAGGTTSTATCGMVSPRHAAQSEGSSSRPAAIEHAWWWGTPHSQRRRPSVGSSKAHAAKLQRGACTTAAMGGAGGARGAAGAAAGGAAACAEELPAAPPVDGLYLEAKARLKLHGNEHRDKAKRERRPMDCLCDKRERRWFDARLGALVRRLHESVVGLLIVFWSRLPRLCVLHRVRRGLEDGRGGGVVAQPHDEDGACAGKKRGCERGRRSRRPRSRRSTLCARTKRLRRDLLGVGEVPLEAALHPAAPVGALHRPVARALRRVEEVAGGAADVVLDHRRVRVEDRRQRLGEGRGEWAVWAHTHTRIDQSGSARRVPPPERRTTRGTARRWRVR